VITSHKQGIATVNY